MPEPLKLSSQDLELTTSDIENPEIQMGELPAPPKSYGSQLLSNAGDYAWGMAKGVGSALNPINIATSLVRPDLGMEQQMQQGEEAFRHGKPIQGALRTAAASVPWLGPAAAGLADSAVQFATGTPDEAGQAVGGAVGMAAGANLAPGVLKAAKTARYNLAPKKAYHAMERITRALDVPKSNAGRYISNLQEAMPHVYEFSQREGRGWDTVKALGQTAKDAAGEYYQKNYKDLSQAYENVLVDAAPIRKAIKDVKSSLLPEDAAMRKWVDKLSGSYKDKSFTIKQLEDFRKTLNARLEGLEEMHQLDRSQLIKAQPKAAAMDRQQKAIRNLINENLDKAGSRYEGATAGVLRTYRSMLDLAERAEKRAPTAKLTEMATGGKRFGPDSLATPIRAVTMRQANPYAAAGGEAATQAGTLLNKPDRLVSSARRLLDKGYVRPAGKKALAQPIPPKTRPLEGQPLPDPIPSQPLSGPILGEGAPIEGQIVTPQRQLTGPQNQIQTNPLPPKMIGAGERREPGKLNRVEKPRRAEDQAVIAEARRLKDIIDDPESRRLGLGYNATDQLDALLEKNPWLRDNIHLINDPSLRRGGVRGGLN